MPFTDREILELTAKWLDQYKITRPGETEPFPITDCLDAWEVRDIIRQALETRRNSK